MADPETHEVRHTYGDLGVGLMADVRVTWRHREDPSRVALSEAVRLTARDIIRYRKSAAWRGDGATA